MNCYDFDKTIYKSDSSVDFYKYCMLHYPKILRHLPAQIKAFVQFYVKHSISKTQMKEVFYHYFQDIPDMEEALADFWDRKVYKIKGFYLVQKDEEDVIISASPAFFLRPVCEGLGIRHLIASEVDPKTGQYLGENCHGEEKVTRFQAEFPEAVVEAFYSDSLSDTPMAKLAQKAYLVKGKELQAWPFEGEAAENAGPPQTVQAESVAETEQTEASATQAEQTTEE